MNTSNPNSTQSIREPSDFCTFQLKFERTRNFGAFLIKFHESYWAASCKKCPKRNCDIIEKWHHILAIKIDTYLLETRFLDLALSLLDFWPWIHLCTFSILLLLYKDSDGVQKHKKNECLSSWLAEQEDRVRIPASPLEFSEIGYILLPSRNMTEIPLKRRKSSIQPINQTVTVRHTRGIWKVMHIHLYNFTQWSEKKKWRYQCKRQDMGLLRVPCFNVCIDAITS